MRELKAANPSLGYLHGHTWAKKMDNPGDRKQNLRQQLLQLNEQRRGIEDEIKTYQQVLAEVCFVHFIKFFSL